MSTVLVLGTGRSGTSVVARILHERLGVPMGDRLPEPSRANPRGAYEDLDFRELHVAHLNGQLSRTAFEARAAELLAARSPPWGLKDPRICHLLDFYLPRLPDADLIVCRRDLEAVARSAASVGAGSLQVQREEMATRARKLATALRDRGHLALDMNDRRSEDELAQVIRAYLDRHATLEGGVA